jgi:hypothetical protein
MVLQDEHLESVAPVLGIAATVGGYTVMELNQDLLTVSVTEGLTEDAVTARLHEGALFVLCAMLLPSAVLLPCRIGV